MDWKSSLIGGFGTYSFIATILGILSYFKIPDRLLENYKSHLQEVNQQKENEFRQKIQQQQLTFEQKLQTTLAKSNQEFEQKVDLLKQRRSVIPIIYGKLLELNGVIKQKNCPKKLKVQTEVNNYIELQRLFLTESLYQEIKKVQTSMNDLSSCYEAMANTKGPELDQYDKRRQILEQQIETQLSKLETSFRDAMF